MNKPAFKKGKDYTKLIVWIAILIIGFVFVSALEYALVRSACSFGYEKGHKAGYDKGFQKGYKLQFEEMTEEVDSMNNVIQGYK